MRLLSDGHCPTLENNLFPSPMQLSAYSGNADMLRLFQEHLPEYHQFTAKGSRWELNWRAKVGPGSFKRAAMLGDMDILRLAIYPPSRSRHDTSDFASEPFGEVSPLSRTGHDLEHAMYSVKTWEMFQYIDSFFSKSALLSEPHSERLLAHHVDLGNTEIARHLLDAGANINSRGVTTNQNPLIIASRNGHEDIVDLLLSRGADPNHTKLEQSISALYAAVSGGHLSIFRKLIDHGARISRDDWGLIDIAVRLEHTAMVKFILGLLNWTYEERQSFSKRALRQGLDSMALAVLGDI